jgi:hypothetical protein
MVSGSSFFFGRYLLPFVVVRGERKPAAQRTPIGCLACAVILGGFPLVREQLFRSQVGFPFCIGIAPFLVGDGIIFL